MDLNYLYDEMTAAGVKNAVVEYNGSGDEGSIDDIRANDGPEIDYSSGGLWRLLEDATYDLLESRHGGWEINEGSTGHIEFDAVERKAKINHGNRVESIEWLETEVV